MLACRSENSIFHRLVGVPIQNLYKPRITNFARSGFKYNFLLADANVTRSKQGAAIAHALLRYSCIDSMN